MTGAAYRNLGSRETPAAESAPLNVSEAAHAPSQLTDASVRQPSKDVFLVDDSIRNASTRRFNQDHYHPGYILT